MYTVVLSNHKKLDKTPRVGQQISIIPTHVLNAKEFYGQLGDYFSALHYSQLRLNFRRMIAENEPYTQLPGDGLKFLFAIFYFAVNQSKIF